MTEGMATPWGQPTEALERLYGRWADGGIGLSITGNVMVDRRYLERPGNVCAEEDLDLGAMRRWTTAAKRGGGAVWAQLSHPGRQCTRLSNRRPVAPSPVHLNLLGFFAAPIALDEAGIEAIIGRFAAAATRCLEGGFDGVQIHAAHGYLLSQFLSPRTNRREDRWGGDLEGRSRCLLRVVAAVREAVGPSTPVAVKLNSADFQRGGFESEDATKVAAMLERASVDLLEISGGTYEQLEFFNRAASTRAREAFFLEFARELRAEVKLPLMVTGGFRTRAVMQEALDSGACDVIGLGRPLCVAPELPRQLLKGEVEAAPVPEAELRLGPGVLGPGSAFRQVRALNAQAQVAWFYRQLLRLAEGGRVDPSLRTSTALRRHLGDEWRIARARRRAFRARGIELETETPYPTCVG